MTPEEAVQPIPEPSERDDGRGQDRADETYRKLRELIVRGQVAPGSRLVETELADRLGVSRTPVRSALQRLRQEGYVVSAGDGKRSGNTVAPLTAEDARELLYILGMLEALAARRCATDEEERRRRIADRLEQINDDLVAAAVEDGGENPRAILTLDDRFHATYVAAGAGSRLKILHEMLRPHKERYMRFYMSGILDEIETSSQEHVRIVEGIRQGDPAATEAAVKDTWRNGADRLTSVIQRRGELGSW